MAIRFSSFLLREVKFLLGASAEIRHPKIYGFSALRCGTEANWVSFHNYLGNCLEDPKLTCGLKKNLLNSAVLRARSVTTLPLVGKISIFLGGEIEASVSRNVEVWLPNSNRTWTNQSLRSLCNDSSKGVNIGENSRRNNSKSDKASAFDGAVKYSVIRVDANGDTHPFELKSSELGLHPRDIDLLSNSSFLPQRATIAVRTDKVIMRMENVRALLSKDHVLLFDARQPRIGANTYGHPSNDSDARVLHRARDAFASTLAQHAKQKPADMLDPMPFHLRIVEALLSETSNYFHQKVDRLKLVVERMLEELTDDVSMGGLQRLLPLKRALTEVEHDVRDAHEAMDQVRLICGLLSLLVAFQ